MAAPRLALGLLAVAAVALGAKRDGSSKSRAASVDDAPVATGQALLKSLHESSAEAASEQLKEMREAAATSVTGLVMRLGANYSDIVLAGPRDWGTIVLYTTSDPRHQCAQCGPAAREMLAAAHSYTRLHPLMGANGTEGTSRLIFAVCDFTLCQQGFGAHDFQTAPHVAFFPPTRSSSRAPKGAHPVPDDRLLSAGTTGIEAARILGLAGMGDVRVMKQAKEKTALASAAAAVAALLAAVVGHSPGGALTFWRKRWVYLLGALCVYAVSIGGFISCVIRQPLAYNYAAPGKGSSGPQPVLFSSGQEQFWAEGFVIAAINLAAAGSLIALVSAVRSQRTGSLGKALLGCAALAAFAVLFQVYLGFYQQKTKWYSLEALPPRELRAAYARGSREAGKWYAEHLQQHAEDAAELASWAVGVAQLGFNKVVGVLAGDGAAVSNAKVDL